jgi:membrane-associated phospholipid phosphatase
MFASPSWPDRARWIAFLKFQIVFSVLFFPIYFGSGVFAAQQQETLGLYWSWERNIPLLPWMIWPYLTLFSLFLLPLFYMATRQIEALTRQSVVVLLIAGSFFLLFPTHSGFSPIAVQGFHQVVFEILAMLDTPHNLAPSLHVAFSALILLGCARYAQTVWAWSFYIWLLVISASTLLVHQHHIFDVVSGLALALLAQRFFRLPPPDEATAQESD